MATAKPPASSPTRRRWLFAGALLLAVLVVAFRAPLTGYTAVGSAYAARVACSCRFVGGRSLADCEKDFEPGLAWVRLSEDTLNKSVTAGFPLLRSDTATYREGWGCRLERWTGTAG